MERLIHYFSKCAVLLAALVTIGHSLVPHVHSNEVEGISGTTNPQENIFLHMFSLDLGERHLEEITLPSIDYSLQFFDTPAVHASVLEADTRVVWSATSPSLQGEHYSCLEVRGPPAVA